MSLQTIATERVRTGDMLVTGSEDRPLRRVVVDVFVSARVYLSCEDGSTPILPLGGLVKVDRERKTEVTS